MPDSRTRATMLATLNTGDQAWQHNIATLDGETLRFLLTNLKCQQNLYAGRRWYVEMLLDLDLSQRAPQPQGETDEAESTVPVDGDSVTAASSDT
jgi:hypothetical protein